MCVHRRVVEKGGEGGMRERLWKEKGKGERMVCWGGIGEEGVGVGGFGVRREGEGEEGEGGELYFLKRKYIVVETKKKRVC